MRPALPVTTVGKKILMGTTGVIWLGFVIGHVAGNLLVFRGSAALNAYSAMLHASAGVLWAVRVVIYGALLLHVITGVALWRAGVRARSVAYARQVPQAATIASRSIRWTGLLVLGFLVFHILHLTTGTLQPVPFQATDVYSNVTRSFRVAWVAAVYVVAMSALALHVLHGAYASFKSLGWARLRSNPFDRRMAVVVALGVWIGFTAIPVAIFSGLLGLTR
jgi:succinate dehydrogenase / fumarate reductase cytochrome b subunit